MVRNLSKKTFGILNRYEQVRQLITYLLIGGFSAISDLTLLYIFVEIFHIFYLLAAAMAFIIVATIAFFFHKRFTFRFTGGGTRIRYLVFIFIAGTGLLLEIVLLFTFVEIFNIWYLLAATITKGIIFFWNFLMNKFITFGKAQHTWLENFEFLIRKNWVVLLAFLLPFIFYFGIFFGRSFGIECTGAGVMGLNPPYQQTVAAKNPYCQFVADIGAYAWQHYPWWTKSADLYKQLDLPLWNQNLGAGVPLAANFQSAVYFPPTMFFAFFKSVLAFDFFFILRFSVVSLGMFLLLRSFNLPKPLSLIGSMIVFLNGYFTYIPTIVHVNVDIMLPWIALFMNKAFQTRQLKYFVFVSFSFALSNLGGQPEPSIFVGFFIAVYSIFLAFLSRKKLKTLGTFILSASLGFLLSAILIIPGYEYIKNSASAHEAIQATAVSKWSFLAWPFPKIFGTLQTAGKFAESHNLYPWSGDYIGTFAVFFLIASVFLLIFKFYDFKKLEFYKHYLFFLIFLLIMLSIHFSLIPNFLAKLPGFSQTQFPKYDLNLLHFLAAAVVVFTLDFLTRLKDKRIIVFTFLIGAGLILLTYLRFFEQTSKIHFYKGISLDKILALQLSFSFLIILATSTLIFFKERFKKNIVLAALLLICGAELFLYVPLVGDLQRKDSFRKPPAIDFLKSRDYKQSRIFSPDYILYPNHSADFDLNDVRNSDALWPKYYYEYLKEFVVPELDKANFRFTGSQELGTLHPSRIENNPFFDLLSVKYFLTYNVIDNNNFEKIYDKEFKIYQYKNFIPRIHNISRIECEENTSQVIKRMRFLGEEIKNIAVLEGTCQDKSYRSIPVLKNQKFEDNKISFSYQSPEKSYLVLSNNFYPGWELKINGETKVIERVNLTFQGFEIPKSEDAKVEIKYKPNSFNLGLAISYLSFLLCIFLIWKFGNRKI